MSSIFCVRSQAILLSFLQCGLENSRHVLCRNFICYNKPMKETTEKQQAVLADNVGGAMPAVSA